jgi:hypothetical protein
VEEQKLFESESWFISGSILVLTLFILVKEPTGKCPLGGPKSKRKYKIVSQEDCDVGKLREIAPKTCKFPQNL